MLLDEMFGKKRMVVKDAHFRDEEQHTYVEFLDVIQNEGIKLPLIFSDRFKQIKYLKENPKMIEAVKKALETHAKNQKKKAQFDQFHFAGEELLQSIPANYFLPEHSLMNVISKEAQKAYSLRELIYDIYPLYADDTIELSISLHGKELFKGEGEIKKLKVPTETITNVQVPKDQVLMMTVIVRLIQGGDNRRRHEERSNIFNVDAEKEYLLSKDYAMSMMLRQNGAADSENPTFKLNETQFIERAKLFGVTVSDQSPASIKKLMDEWQPGTLGAKELTDIRDVYKRFYQFETNEELMKFKAMLNLELEKTRNWLTRDNADGFDGKF